MKDNQKRSILRKQKHYKIYNLPIVIKKSEYIVSSKEEKLCFQFMI